MRYRWIGPLRYIEHTGSRMQGPVSSRVGEMCRQGRRFARHARESVNPSKDLHLIHQLCCRAPESRAKDGGLVSFERDLRSLVGRVDVDLEPLISIRVIVPRVIRVMRVTQRTIVAVIAERPFAPRILSARHWRETSSSCSRSWSHPIVQCQSSLLR